MTMAGWAGMAVAASAVALLAISSCGAPAAAPDPTASGPPAPLVAVDRPGVSGVDLVPAAFDTRAGVIVALDQQSGWPGHVSTWEFDPTTGRWSSIATTGAPAGDAFRVVYDAGVDRTLAMPIWNGSVWAYDRDARTWTRIQQIGGRPYGITDVVYDPDRQLAWAWDDASRELWTFSARNHRWRQVAASRPAPWPNTQVGGMGDGVGYTLMTYDTRLRRPLLAVLPLPGRTGRTWTFDPEGQRWVRMDGIPPWLMLGYGEWGTEGVYDASHDRTMLYSLSGALIYDSAADRWVTPDRDGWNGLTEATSDEESGPLARYDHTLVFDPIGERVILLGGVSRLFDADRPLETQNFWWYFGDVWAYDIDANQWTELLPAMIPPPDAPG